MTAATLAFFFTTSSKWQATIHVEREGKKVRRNVGSFETKGEAAVQRALAIAGYIDVASPALRAMRSKGARFPHPWPCPNPFVTSPCYMCAGPDIEAVTSRAALGENTFTRWPGAAKVLAAHTHGHAQTILLLIPHTHTLRTHVLTMTCCMRRHGNRGDDFACSPRESHWPNQALVC